VKVMIVVTHLLGTGHLARALTLARAYHAAGDTVCVVSGGMPVSVLPYKNIAFIQLPAVRSDGVDFSRLLTSTGASITDVETSIRQRMLLDAYREFTPDILITELFPFGRRILRDEFQALLDLAKRNDHRPLICCSIRDILAPPSKPKKAIFADDVIANFYDAVLVHSDSALMPLELSWPVSAALQPKLHYTGFVAPAPAGAHPDHVGTGEVIISAGGGDVGGPIYEAALAAAPRITRSLRILVGGGASSEGRIIALRTRAPVNVTVEPARPDFRQMLNHAAASISLCGYNTALDILQAGTPAVFIPFDEGNEVEQGIRAKALAQQTGIITLPRVSLTPDALCNAIETVIAAPRRKGAAVEFEGAKNTVSITHNLRNAI